MNVLNKLSINLQQIVLDKIFQNQKNIYKNIISNINSLKGKHLYGISHPNYDLINSKNIKYCVHFRCSTINLILKQHLIYLIIIELCIKRMPIKIKKSFINITNILIDGMISRKII